jgi:four helix bundle protein
VRLRGLPCRVAYQLFDAAGSIGANRAEAISGYTDKEFASKNAICLKESREALFWLRVGEAKALGDAPKRHALLREANELVSIFVTVVRTLQKKKGSG